MDGNICAAIKVISDMDGFSYDSNNGVVKVSDGPGVDMVYLSAGERKLDILHTGYAPLEIILSEVGIQLKEKEVWEIRVSGEKKLINIPINIITQPAGAAIYLDGQNLGTGTTFQVTKGTHTLKIVKDGYRTIEKTIDVSESSTLFNITLEEVDLVAVQVKSTPQQATVFIDNIEKGQTDCGIWLYPGEYELKLSKTDYLDAKETINVTESGNNVFNYNLVKNIGTLSLTLSPSDATIKLNNRIYSSHSIELVPGNYQLEVSKSGYLPVSKSITVVLGETVRENITLTRNAGYLDISVTPSGAKVLVNKEDHSNQSRITLAPGQYKIEISQQGYRDISEVVSIELGRAISKSYNLEQITGNLLFNISPLEAKVELKRNGRTIENWTGMKSLKDLPIGEYQVSSSASGYDNQSKTITISENKTTNIDIKMEKRSVASSNLGGQRDLGGLNSGNNMILVRGGTFQMGSNNGDSDEKPVHSVTVNDFYISKYEVTFAEYDKFCEATNREKPSDEGWGRGNRPVINVTWDDAVAYCKWAGGRLPTEAEWEYAARGGNQSRGYTYSGNNDIDKVAWYTSNSGNKTHPVGEKQANELGIYDMTGNVWEWCSDWYGTYPSSSQTNPDGAASGSSRVLRGGSWFNDQSGCRVANRGRNGPEDRSSGIGFRLAHSL
ncbi:MAG: SUMF1/EgtB/PvdO family nonheme iron enzyme [Candidatus Marinimicrobia bacterium]|nr:SUMF1/EgtB/PvdO family nonheme iron enzyme [Candidatus Neomarinimicrobiota bacterium]